MFRSRFRRNALLVVVVALFAALGAQTASADGNRRVFLRFAGDFIQNLEQTDAAEEVPGNTTSLLGLVRGKVRGNLGRADMTAATRGENREPVWDER